MIDSFGKIQLAAMEYGQDLAGFTRTRNLPGVWFMIPDHLAVKASGATDFERIINYAVMPVSEWVTYVEMDDRRIAAAKLLSPLALSTMGSVSWLEVMEPRPEKAGNDVVGVDHAEFFYPNFDDVRATLGPKDIRVKHEGNDEHDWLTVKLNNRGQEVKLSDGMLADIVQRQHLAGVGRVWGEL